MKNRFSFYLLYGMTVFLGGLGLLLLVFGQKTPHASYRENRMLAGFPALTVKTVTDGSFMTGLEDYLNDNIPDRENIIEETASIMNRLTVFESQEEETDQEKLMNEVAAYAEEPKETPLPAMAQSVDPTPEPFEPATETDAPAPSELSAESPASVPEQKDLSLVPTCRLDCIQPDGSAQTIYTYESADVQRTIRMLNAYRAVLPEHGHVFFAQPPFPGLAGNLSEHRYIGWNSDVEDAINAYSVDGVYAANVPALLEQPLLNGEDLYFTTDHHWKARAACYTVNDMLKTMGIDPIPYDSYSFEVYRDFYGSAANSPGYRSSHKPDTADVMLPSTPVKGYQVYWDRSEREAPLIAPTHSYMTYLGGILGPWRRFETGVDCGRNCLVIGDSFATVLVSYLTPYYETVHVTDIRADYYDPKHVAWSISDYIKEHNIEDVYIILSTASGVNSVGLIESLQNYL